MRLFRVSLVPASILSTLGVVIKMLVVGTVAWLVTPLTFVQGLLLGAILAPTDAAAVFTRLPPRSKRCCPGPGLKGAVPIILAIVPLQSQVPNSMLLFNIVLVVVVFSTAVQGRTIVPLAKRLGLTRKEPPEPPLRVELGGVTPPGSGVYDVFLQQDTEAVGRTLQDLALPETVIVAAIYRSGEMITPRGGTVLNAGDHVFILSTKADSVRIPMHPQVTHTCGSQRG